MSLKQNDTFFEHQLEIGNLMYNAGAGISCEWPKCGLPLYKDGLCLTHFKEAEEAQKEEHYEQKS